MTINELALQVVEAMKKHGYSEQTAWGLYADSSLRIVKIHEKCGKTEYDSEVMRKCMRYYEERVANGQISLKYYENTMNAFKRLMIFYETGKLELPRYTRVSKFKLTAYYDEILKGFINSEDFHKNTLGDIIWVSKKYFAWLVAEGYSDLSAVGADEITRFICFCFERMAVGSVYNVKIYLKKLYRYYSRTKQ